MSSPNHRRGTLFCTAFIYLFLLSCVFAFFFFEQSLHDEDQQQQQDGERAPLPRVSNVCGVASRGRALVPTKRKSRTRLSSLTTKSIMATTTTTATTTKRTSGFPPGWTDMSLCRLPSKSRKRTAFALSMWAKQPVPQWLANWASTTRLVQKITLAYRKVIFQCSQRA